MGNVTGVDGFKIDSEGRLARQEPDLILEEWRSGGGPFWIHVGDEDHEARAEMLTKMGLDDASVEGLLDPGHAPRVQSLAEGLFLEIPVALEGDPPELRSSGLVYLDRLVVTLGRNAVGTADWADSEAISGLRLSTRTAGGLTGALLISLSGRLRRQASVLRERVAEASRRLDQEPTEVTLEEILDLKRAVLDLEAVAEERVAVLETLGEVKHPLLDIDTFGNEFRVVLGNTAATLRRAERLERRGADLQFRYDSLQQETTNRRLSRLTIISAIFLPLTLVAGIYGMNFEIMPELHFALGYPIVLGAMAIGGLGLLWWFRARGWMD